MSSNESAAFEIMNELDVDYVLVIFGGVIGFSGILFKISDFWRNYWVFGYFL